MRFAVLSIAVALSGPVRAGPGPWPDTAVGRLAALAVIETLNAELLSHDSATATLEAWCAAHRLADPARITAEPDAGGPRAASPEQRHQLAVTDEEPIRYRRVRLACGTHVLSEAENWYVPARLTTAMNLTLDTTRIPFGKAVRDLHFRRHTLSADLLWQPLPVGWEMGIAPATPSTTPLVVPAHVLQHRAVLTLPDGTPFSTVVETYTGDVLGFPAPALP